ncbi:MAG: alpha/beta fold hydrolase [Salinivirgaceae bacterium]
MPIIPFQQKNISYNKYHKGPCILLLHGFLETKEVWDAVAEQFENYTIIAPDLPGHGASDVIAAAHTMELMAEAINAILEHENIEACFIYGHSMGGYVAQAFSRMFPQKVKALGLLHSTLYADSPEKKENRLREIELIKKGKQSLVVTGMLPKIVASQNLPAVRQTVETIMERAKGFKPEGIIATLMGMMQRVEHQVVPVLPFHLVGSDADQFIPIELYQKMADENPSIQYDCISGCGHTSFIEKPKIVIPIVKKFLHSATK